MAFTGAGGVKLSATLTLPDVPAGGARVPAVVLVAGSGPTDRDGNQPPLLWTGLLKQISATLADAGFASLRYDKRGQYRSGPAPRGPAALAEFVAWENFVGDVVAARAALRDVPEVDAGRVALLGHSEGGLLVMHAAVALQEAGDPPAALVLLATPGRPPDVVLREQLAASFARLGVARAGVDRLLARNDAIIAEIREHGTIPGEVPADLQPLYPRYAGRFLQTLFRTTPADLVARVDGPVLVVQGEKDIQVSAERDARVLMAALEKRPGAPRSDFVLLEGASHNLKRIEKDSDFGFFGPVVPAARRGLVAWLSDTLKDGGRPADVAR